MHEELENFERNKVWFLVEPLVGHILMELNGFSKTNKMRMV